MHLNVLASGSSGNGYIIQNETEALIIECGVPLKEAVRVLDGQLGKVSGCLVTHSHGDHAGYISQYMRPFHIYATNGTLEEKKALDGEFHCHALPMLSERMIGGFDVKVFDTVHDTKEPCGFVINHPDAGNMLFLTDTHHVKYRFSFPLDYILIECNHADELVDANIKNGIIPRNVGLRAKATHMSLARCIRCLQETNLSRVKAIILIHMSAKNGNEEQFKSAVMAATGKPVYVAKKGFFLPLF